MNFYRIKQFYLSITDKINNNDRKFICKYLNSSELNLFYKLRQSEQKHSIRVARGIENHSKLNSKLDKDSIDYMELVHVALLHDIGKTKARLTSIEKAILVILNFITKGKINGYIKINRINNYINHGEVGCNILKNFDAYSDKFLYIIRNHHNHNINSYELDILRIYDNIN